MRRLSQVISRTCIIAVFVISVLIVLTIPEIETHDDRLFCNGEAHEVTGGGAVS
jgi:competence protein ComGC